MVALTDTKRRLVRQNIPSWAVYPPIKKEEQPEIKTTFIDPDEDFQQKLIKVWNEEEMCQPRE